MGESNLQRSVDQLIDWSKWLITISFTSGVGCVIGLKTASDIALEKTGAVFFFAILFFSLSIVCSALFVLLLSNMKYQPPTSGKIKHRWLATLQMVLFSSALFFVLVWIGILAKAF